MVKALLQHYSYSIVVELACFSVCYNEFVNIHLIEMVTRTRLNYPQHRNYTREIVDNVYMLMGRVIRDL